MEWEPRDMGWVYRREAALGSSEPGSSPIFTQPVGCLGLRDPICDLGVVTVDLSQERGITHLFINLLGEYSTFSCPQLPVRPPPPSLLVPFLRPYTLVLISCCLSGPGTLILLPTVGSVSLTAAASDWPSSQAPGLISNPIFCHGTSSCSCWWPAPVIFST